MTPTFYILSTGTELTSGRSRDANAPHIARTLSETGFGVYGMGTLPDNPETLYGEIRHLLSLEQIDGVIMTGGMGPTDDDHTLDVIARLTGYKIVEDERALRKLEEKAATLPHRIRVDQARRQVRVLEGATVLNNPHGLAPGVLVEVNRPGTKPALIAAMSGFPAEMHPILSQELLPRLLERFSPTPLHRSLFYIYSEGESSFQSLVFGTRENAAPSTGRRAAKERASLASRADLPEDFRWGISAGRGHLRVFFESSRAEPLERLQEAVKSHYGNRFLQEASDETIHRLCLDSRITIGVAESCTGGLVGKILTDRSGSSSYFMGSLVTYSNEAKQRVLGVPPETLEKYGAVSPQTAEAMAEGALRALECDFALSITGIAGPEGGTPEKPVGTVYVGCAGKGRSSRSERLYFPLDRHRVREFTAGTALYLLFRFIQEKPLSEPPS